MKILNKFIKTISIIFIISYFCALKSYAGDITVYNVFNYSVEQLANGHHKVDQNGYWTEKGWTSCTQANSDKGYSETIVSAYETLYDKTAGTIVANSYSRESGQTFKKSSGKDIRNFAAALSLDKNIRGVRAALMACINNNRLSQSATVTSDNNDGSKFADGTLAGGSSTEWEAENQKLRDKYKNYKRLEKVDITDKVQGKEVSINGTNYIQMGPFKMKFGTSKLTEMTINNQSVFGKGIAKYRIAGENEVKKQFNETLPGETNAFALNNKKFYVLVSKSKLKDLVGDASTITIKFTQADFSYEKGRALVCNDYDSDQGNIWYIHKSATVKGGTATFEVKLTDSIDIVVNKVWEDNNAKDRPSSVKVKISAGGEVIKVINGVGRTSITKTITSSGTVTFSDLKRKDAAGNLLEYTVEEVVPDGYTASYTAKSLTMKENKSVYTTTITNKKDGSGEKIDTDLDVGDLLITKEGGNMSFRVWEDSPAQWITSESTGSGSCNDTRPEDELNGVKISKASESDKSSMKEIDAGSKVGSYVYTEYYDISETAHYKEVTTKVPKKDSNGNVLKDKDGKVITETKKTTELDYYSYTYKYKTTKKECVHKETHDWLGSYKTVDGLYKIKGLYPGTYEIYETDCDQYYDLEIQDGYSKTGYHGVPNIRLASTVSLAENSSETVKLGLPASITVHNDRTRGDLEIEKTYETGEPIDEVEIAIYGEVNEGEYHYSGWLTTEGSYEDVKWNAISSIFSGSPSNPYVTEDGKISITGLPVGTYKIYEVKTKSIEYALEGQGSFDGEKTLLGTVTITRNQESAVQVSYAQKKRPKGDVVINKTGIYVNNQLSSPNVTGKLANVSFILSSKATDKGGWKNGTYVYTRTNEKGEDIVDFTDNKDDATVFTTDSEGKVTILGLYEDLGPYEIEEVENDIQDKYYTDPIVIKGDTTVNAPSTASIINLRSSGDLRIEKVDENYHDLKLSGGKFKLKLVSSEYAGVSNMWLGSIGLDRISEGNTYDYNDSKHGEYLVSNVDSAMEFETDSNGEINIKKIINGTYEVYETKTPTGYDITKQDGYDPNTGMVYRGKVTISTNDNVVNYQVVNKKVVNKIDGFVWVDEKDSKANIYNNLYKDNSDEKDYVKEGIQVNLIDKNTGKTMASTVTDKNGYYEFTRYSDGSYIIYWDLAHSYVEYIYNNKIIYTDDTKKEAKEYGFIVVDPFAGGQSKISINSKAQAKEITKDEQYDDNLTGTEGSYPGRAVTYTSSSELGFSEILKQNEEVTPNDGNKNNDDSKNTNTFLEDKLLTAYFDENKFTIENINLGLKEKNPTTHAIDESIEYVKIVKGNYTFKYKYGEDAVTEEGYEQSAPTVKFQNSSKTFTQNIYPSDIKYNLANDFNDNDVEKFRVYVVYKIDIQNTTTMNDKELYAENGLYLTQLVNTYDSSRFQISKDKLPNADKDEEIISNDFGLWNELDDNKTTTSSDDKVASFNIADSTKAYNPNPRQGGIKAGETVSTYIQYRVTDNALNQLLSKGKLEDAPTSSTSYGYHIYERKDKNWQNKDTYKHRTIQEIRTDGALYLRWNLLNPRTISGTVFEDKEENSRENERIGNGKYDEDKDEKKLTNVVVSLIDKSTDNIASVYNGDLNQDSTTGKWKSKSQPATVQVGEDGKYKLEGVVPGEYYLQFTYGDGKVDLKDVNGNSIEKDVNGISIEKVETKRVGESSPLNSNYYKSTIITGSAQNAKEENASTWFLGSIKEGVNSVASDYRGTYYDKDGKPITGKENIDIINFRTNSNDELNYTTSQYKVVINARTPKMNVQFENDESTSVPHNKELPKECSGMSFGIIERPHVRITLEKEIKNIKLTLQNGTTIINGNPNEQKVSPYLAAINKAYSKIEMPSEYIYGSELKVTYKFIVTNESELDYATDKYYKYGEKDKEKIVKTKVTKMVDYLSYNESKYVEEEKNNITNIYGEGENEECKKDTYFAPDVDKKNSSYAKKYIVTKEIDLMPKASGKSSTAEYIATVSRLIGNSDNDAGIDNVSEIIGIKNVTFSPQYGMTSGNRVIKDADTSEDDDSNATIVITPPTGENRSYTMYIVAGISLIVIAGGVILIKKFIL